MVNRTENTSQCQICGRVAREIFAAPCDYRNPSIKKSYSVYWCHSCDYGFLWPRPPKEEVASFYLVDNYYTHSAKDEKQLPKPVLLSFLDRLRMHLAWRLDRGQNFAVAEVSHLLSSSTPAVLDLGCGSGGNLARFASHGCDAVGVEPDAEARKAARENGHHVLDGTAEHLPDDIAGSKFDLVLMSHVLEHCLDVDIALSNVKGVLKTDGILVVEVPNCECSGFRIQQSAWPWSDIPRHLNFFTPKSLKDLLIKQGFTIRAEKFTGFTRQFSNEWLSVESDVWRAFRDCEDGVKAEPSYKLRSWKLLVKSLFSAKATKYDSIRVLASNSDQE